MRDEDRILRNLKLKQDAFFRATDREGMTLSWWSAETGIPAGTLASYKITNGREPSVMGLATFVKLVASLPAQHIHLASLLIEDSGCFIAQADSRGAEWLALGEKACAFGAKVMRYQASDNHIDHIEAGDLRHDLIEFVTVGTGALGEGGGA
jgi:hypothetical protein